MHPALIDRNTNLEVEGGYEIRLFGWTEDRYFAQAPSDRFCEFMDGEVIMHSPVDVTHTHVVRLLVFLLSGFCRVRAAGTVLTGPTALRLRPGLAREPDIFVVAPQDAEKLHGCRTEVAPLLVVEVAGQDSERRDLVEKAAEYAARGVPEYWVVLVERRQMVVHRPGTPGLEHVPLLSSMGQVASTALPGFFVVLDWLWQAAVTDEIAALKAILGVTAL